MNRMIFSLVFTCIYLSLSAQEHSLPHGFPVTDRTKTNLNNGWNFHFGDPSGNPGAVNFDDSTWEKVSVPHTLKLVSYELDSIRETWVQKKFLRDVGWYRKTIKVIADADKRVFLEFEGVHNATELWVNGKKVGDYAINGYVPFNFDITDYVKFGADNLIAIKADNRFDPTISPDPDRTDYVKFGGLYRNLYLVTTNKLHVNYNWENFEAGVAINTPTVNKKNGTVTVRTTVINDNSTAKNCTLVTRIINADGYVVKKMSQHATIPGNAQHTFRQTTGVEEDYHLWSPETPYLYRVNSVVQDEGKPVDFVENTFGFRTFKLVRGSGFVLNGEPIFLIGANRHQNYPNIGDAVPDSFHYHEAMQYKKAGLNIIRLSHYTQDDAFIKACDELGILVYEEPSTWIEWGDDTWFSKLEAATRTMIRNHRNHPSIVFWGAGINHRGPVPQMQYVTKEEDPFRLTASASSPWNGVKNAGITDVYATMDYRRSDWPESDFTMVMEHGSSPNAEKNQFHISRYKSSKKNIAAIAWLGADYNHLQPDIADSSWSRGFMTSYAILSAYRVPKPVYYWYQSELVPDPIVYIGDETVSNNGKVRVFSNCQEVALYHDGNLVAKQLPDNDPNKAHLDHPSFTFHYRWNDGTLRAVGYTNGKKITEASRTKAGEPHYIKVKFNIDDQPFYTGGSDLRMAHAYVMDKNGEVVTSADNKITFKISGEGTFVDNGKIYANPAMLYDGVATIYVRAAEKVGKITVTAESAGLKSGSASLTTVEFNTDEIQKNARPIYDYPTVKVDVGGEKQLVQHQWQAWTGSTDKDLSFDIEDHGKAKVTVSAPDGIVKWLGNTAMLGDLSFMGTDGLYSEMGVLKLRISGLEKGNYYLRTYHHVRRKDTKMANNFEVTVQDDRGEFTKTADDHIVDYYKHDDTGEREPLYINTYFQTDFHHDIKIIFTNKDKGDMWLNGFELEKRKAPIAVE